jgi:signal transduction histidine kinase
VEVRGRLFLYQGRPRILGVVRDISERAQAFELLEARVAARTREIAALLEVSYTLASTLELQPLLRLILDTLVAVVPYQAAAVFILEGEDTLRLLEYAGPLSAEVIARRWPLAQARHSGEVIRTGRSLIIPDVYAPSPAARAFRETAIDHLGAVPPDIACWMGVPLVCRERVIGMLAFDHGERGFFTAHHAELAHAAANQAAVAIENARLYAQAQHAAAQEERQRLARELHDSVTQALYGVTMFAEAASRHLAAGSIQTASGYLRELQQTAQEAMQEMRLLIFELRPPVLEERGLAAALLARVGSVEAAPPVWPSRPTSTPPSGCPRIWRGRSIASHRRPSTMSSSTRRLPP